MRAIREALKVPGWEAHRAGAGGGDGDVGRATSFGLSVFVTLKSPGVNPCQHDPATGKKIYRDAAALTRGQGNVQTERERERESESERCHLATLSWHRCMAVCEWRSERLFFHTEATWLSQPLVSCCCEFDS